MDIQISSKTKAHENQKLYKANFEFFAKNISKNKNKPHWNFVENGLKSKD